MTSGQTYCSATGNRQIAPDSPDAVDANSVRQWWRVSDMLRPGMQIEIEQEDDGRWLTEIPDLPGVMVYAATRDEAVARVKALALRVLADRLEHGETIPDLVQVFSMVA